MNMERLRQRLNVEEGRRSKVYLDSLGIPTIGVGFNLQRTDAPRKLAAYGYDYDEVLAGRQTLAESTIDALLTDCIEEAVANAKSLIETFTYRPFDELPDVVREVLTDMVFNLGAPRVAGFKNMLSAINLGKYSRAADEMLDSLWARQVGDRAQRLAGLMRSAQEA